MSELPKKPTIIIDTREKPENALFEPSEVGDKDVAAYRRDKVDAGDYTIADVPNLVVIEKKQDGKELYANCILKKDVFLRMIERMRAYKHKYIIIQQSYTDFLNPKKWTFVSSFRRRFGIISAVESWLIYFSQKEGIHFIFADPKNAPRLAKKILLKSYEYERKRRKNEHK